MLLLFGWVGATPQQVDFYKKAITGGNYKNHKQVEQKQDNLKLKFYLKDVILKDKGLTPKEKTELKRFISAHEEEQHKAIAITTVQQKLTPEQEQAIKKAEKLKDDAEKSLNDFYKTFVTDKKNETNVDTLRVYLKHLSSENTDHVKKAYEILGRYMELVSRDFDPTKDLTRELKTGLVNAHNFLLTWESKDVPDEFKNKIQDLIRTERNDQTIDLSSLINRILTTTILEKGTNRYDSIKNASQASSITSDDVETWSEQVGYLKEMLMPGEKNKDIKDLLGNLDDLKKDIFKSMKSVKLQKVTQPLQKAIQQKTQQLESEKKLLEKEVLDLTADKESLKALEDFVKNDPILNKRFEDLKKQKIAQLTPTVKQPTTQVQVTKTIIKPKLADVITKIQTIVEAVENKHSLDQSFFPSAYDFLKKFFYEGDNYKNRVQPIYDKSIKDGERYKAINDLIEPLSDLLEEKCESSDADREIKAAEASLRSYILYVLANIKPSKEFSSDLDEMLYLGQVVEALEEANDLVKLKEVLFSWLLDPYYKSHLFFDLKKIMGFKEKVSVFGLLQNPPEKIEKIGIWNLLMSSVLPGSDIKKDDSLIAHLVDIFYQAATSGLKDIDYDLNEYFNTLTKKSFTSWDALKKALNEIAKKGYKNQNKIKNDVTAIVDAIEEIDLSKIDKKERKGYFKANFVMLAATYPALNTIVYKNKVDEYNKEEGLKEIKADFDTLIITPLLNNQIKTTQEFIIKLDKIEEKYAQKTYAEVKDLFYALFAFNNNKLKNDSVYKVLEVLVSSDKQAEVKKRLKYVIEPTHFANKIYDLGNRKIDSADDLRSDKASALFKQFKTYIKSIQGNIEPKELDKYIQKAQGEAFKFVFENIDFEHSEEKELNIRQAMIVLLSILSDIFPHSVLFDLDNSALADDLDSIFKKDNRIVYGSQSGTQVSSASDDEDSDDDDGPPKAPDLDGDGEIVISEVLFPDHKTFETIKKDYLTFLATHEAYFTVLNKVFKKYKSPGSLKLVRNAAFFIQHFDVIVSWDIIREMKKVINGACVTIIQEKLKSATDKKTARNESKALLTKIKALTGELLTIIEGATIKEHESTPALYQNKKHYYVKMPIEKNDYSTKVDTYKKKVNNTGGDLQTFLGGTLFKDVKDQVVRELLAIVTQFNNCIKNMFDAQYPLVPGYVCGELEKKRKKYKRDFTKVKLDVTKKKPIAGKQKVQTEADKFYNAVFVSKDLSLVKKFDVKQLLSHDYGKGEIILHLLAKSKNIPSMQVPQFIQYFKSVDASVLDKKDNDGNTPLHTAAEFNNFDVVKSLVAEGADVEVENSAEQIPLHVACSHGTGAQKKIITILLGTDNKGINKKDKQGKTPLAVLEESKGNTILIDFLKKEGATA